MDRKPAIRFNGFAGEWSDRLFSDTYLSASEGGTPSTNVKEFYDGGKIPFVKIEDTEKKYIFGTSSHITEQGLNHSSAWLVPKDNIIFTNGATIGNVAINRVPVSTKQGILGVVVDKSKYDLEYLFYALSNEAFQDEVAKRQSKGTFATIILGNLNKISVPYTDIVEQKKIGDFLKAFDELIDNSQEELDRMRTLKTAMLEQMFPCAGENMPRIRFKGFSEPWERKSLRDLLVCSMDYGMNAAAKKYDGTHKYLRITDIDEYSRQFSRSDLTSPNVVSFDSNYELKEGDIVFARTGASVGKTYIYDKRDGLVYFAGFLIRARIDLEKFCPYFVFASTQVEDYRRFIKITSQRTGQPGVNAQEYESFSLLVPSLDEQRRIGDFFAELDNAINATANKITKLKKTKRALLDKMLVAS